MNKVSIVGAGLVGSLLAGLLAKKGYKADVFDLRPDPRNHGYKGGRSINMALSHRGWQALERLGIREEVEDVAIPMYGRMMHDPEGNLTFQPYGRNGQAIYSVSRANLNLVLINHAARYKGSAFHFAQKCLSVNFKQGQLTFQDMASEQLRTFTSNVIFGSDGAFSKVRQAMQKRSMFNYSQQYIAHGYKELSIPPAANGDFAMEPNALHIWPRRSYMLIALPNPDRSFTVTLFFPYKGAHSFETVPDGKAAKAFFKEYFPDALSLMPNLQEEYDKNPIASLLTIKCNPWSMEQGLLLGDAAHAILPFFGQGMNAGFEDCDTLLKLMDGFDGDWKGLFKTFEQERIPNTDAIAELAYRNFIEMRDAVADPGFLLRKKIEAKLYEQFPDKWVPLYSMVTFSSIPYAEALKRGRVQEKIMDRLMEIPEVRHHWETYDFTKLSIFEDLGKVEA